MLIIFDTSLMCALPLTCAYYKLNYSLASFASTFRPTNNFACCELAIMSLPKCVCSFTAAHLRASERAPEIFFFCLFTLFLAVCSGCGRPSCRTAQISVSLQVNCEIFPLTLQSYERETRAVLQIGKFLRAATVCVPRMH